MTVNTRLHSLWKYNFDPKSNRYIVIFACFLRFHKLGFGLRFAPVLIFLRLTNCSTLLSLQIEMESQKNTATNLERISGDYKQMKEENNVLAKKLKAAKWVNRRLFYTNRYFLMNNASRNKEFDWSDIFCSLLSLLFLFESLMNQLLRTNCQTCSEFGSACNSKIIQYYRVRCHTGYRVILGVLADYKITRCCYRRLKWSLPLDQEYLSELTHKLMFLIEARPWCFTFFAKRHSPHKKGSL